MAKTAIVRRILLKKGVTNNGNIDNPGIVERQILVVRIDVLVLPGEDFLQNSGKGTTKDFGVWRARIAISTGTVSSGPVVDPS